MNVFGLAALQEMRRLGQDYRFLTPRFRRRPGIDAALTWSALRINERVWAPLRLKVFGEYKPDMASRLAPGDLVRLPPGLADVSARSRRGILRLLIPSGQTSGYVDIPWPSTALDKVPDPKDLAGKITDARRKAGRHRHRDWQDHYNAACAYAIAVVDYIRVEDRQAVQRGTELAIAELREAARNAEAGFVARQKTWLIFEDPDLQELRNAAVSGHKPFEEFEDMAFPTPAPRPGLPHPIVKLQMAAFDRQFLVGIAETMERTWRQRSHMPPDDIFVLDDWLTAEVPIWESLDRVVRNNARDWQERQELEEAVRHVTSPDLWPSTASHTEVPDYDKVLGDGNRRAEKLGDPPEDFDRDLMRLYEILHVDGHEIVPIDRAGTWLDWCRKAEAAGGVRTSISDVRLLSTRFATLWLEIKYGLQDNGFNVSHLSSALRRLPEPPPDQPGHP